MTGYRNNGGTTGQISRRSFFALSAGLAFGVGVVRLGAAGSRVVVVGDVHGDYDRFVDVLMMSGLVDGKRKWSGGSSILVQVGDVLDRGPLSRKALDLLMDLQKQAPKKGGQVEMILGNHEVMRMVGDYRYVSEGEYAEFKTNRSQELRDVLFERLTKEQGLTEDPRQRQDLQLGYRQKWDKEHPLGFAEMMLGFGIKGRYGRWLRQRPVAVVAGGNLIVHGGISEKYVMWNDDRFRERMISDVNTPGADTTTYLYDDLGPFWWRGLATDTDEALTPQVDQVLGKWGAQRMVVGHTPLRGPVKSRLDGKVLLADVGLSSYFGGPRACVVTEGGTASMILEGKQAQFAA